MERSPIDSKIVPIERITHVIVLLRGHKVMLDADLAALYGVETRALIQAVKRNADRFPADFMISLTTRGRVSKITNCDLKEEPRSAPEVPPLRFHGAGDRDALIGSTQPSSGSGQHRNHAGIRATTARLGVDRGARQAARRARTKVRRAVRRRVSSDSQARSAAGIQEAPDRVQDEPDSAGVSQTTGCIPRSVNPVGPGGVSVT